MLFCPIVLLVALAACGGPWPGLCPGFATYAQSCVDKTLEQIAVFLRRVRGLDRDGRHMSVGRRWLQCCFCPLLASCWPIFTLLQYKCSSNKMHLLQLATVQTL